VGTCPSRIAPRVTEGGQPASQPACSEWEWVAAFFGLSNGPRYATSSQRTQNR